MKVVEAVNEDSLMERNPNAICVFLAGGITNCPDWQKEVISYLEEMPDTDNLILYNPRRSFFDVTDKSASSKQIQWEFNYLAKMDIFSMYFTNSDSVQPICFYELGRHLSEMQRRFPETYMDRIVVSVEPGFSRETDVRIQTLLALELDKKFNTHEEVHSFFKTSAKDHAQAIYNAYKRIEKARSN